MSAADQHAGDSSGGPDAPTTRIAGSTQVRWLWPFPPVQPRVAAFVRAVAEFPSRLLRGWFWLPAAVALGTLPLLVCWFARVPGHQIASALFLFPLFLCGVYRASPTKTLLVVLIAFSSHSFAVVVASAHDPARAAAVLPGAESFWAESREWIETGRNEEYEPRRWLPQHFLLFVAVIGLAYCSLGLSVLLRGFYEVDLMNYYVGRLVSESHEAATAVIYGWHVWSLVRGVGCALLMYEISSISLARLTGDDLGAGRGRRLRLIAGVALLLLDCVLKFLLMDSIQARLQSNLL